MKDDELLEKMVEATSDYVKGSITSKECSAKMANALNTYKEQLTLAGVTASALLLNAKDWWATECWHKKYDELTKQQQRIIDKEFTVFKLYRDFLHSR